jgi:hypothetical protein
VLRTIARLLAAVVAIALFAAGVVAVIEVIAAAFGADPVIAPRDDWARNGRTTHWNDTDVRVFFVILAVIGVILLFVALGRRRPTYLPVTTGTGAEVEAASVRRASVEANLASTARSVDGVRAARVRVDRRRIRVKTTTNRKDLTGLDAAVQAAVDGRLTQIALASPLPVRVATQTKDR